MNIELQFSISITLCHYNQLLPDTINSFLFMLIVQCCQWDWSHIHSAFALLIIFQPRECIRLLRWLWAVCKVISLPFLLLVDLTFAVICSSYLFRDEFCLWCFQIYLFFSGFIGLYCKIQKAAWCFAHTQLGDCYCWATFLGYIC